MPLKIENGFPTTLYWVYDYLSILGLKSNHVSKRSPRSSHFAVLPVRSNSQNTLIRMTINKPHELANDGMMTCLLASYDSSPFAKCSKISRDLWVAGTYHFSNENMESFVCILTSACWFVKKETSKHVITAAFWMTLSVHSVICWYDTLLPDLTKNQNCLIFVLVQFNLCKIWLMVPRQCCWDASRYDVKLSSRNIRGETIQ